MARAQIGLGEWVVRGQAIKNIIYYIAVRDCLTHYFFLGVIGQGSGSDWTLVVSPSLRTQDLVPHLTRKIDKNLIEIGPYGSPWVHIERIRSHRQYKGFEIPKMDLVCNIRLNQSLDVGLGNIF